MPAEPTREELLAQVASIQHALSRVPARTLRRYGKASADTIQSQIDQIQTVISSGVNSAGYGDKRTEFRSLTELRQILNGLEEDLAAALGMGGRVRQIRMTTQADKGL
jgi:phage terminase Nu1 subunit (DNA packaging protein)